MTLAFGFKRFLPAVCRQPNQKTAMPGKLMSDFITLNRCHISLTQQYDMPHPECRNYHARVHYIVVHFRCIERWE